MPARQIEPPRQRLVEVDAPEVADDWPGFYPLEGSRPKLLLELPDHACRWPVGSSVCPFEQLFCAENATEGAYCPDHSRALRSISSGKNRRRSRLPAIDDKSENA